MNEDEMQATEPIAGEDLERQLARYARVRLDPTPAQSRRARTAVLEAAWRRRLEVPEGARAARRWHGPFSAWSARRVAASLSAAVLAGLLVGSTAFATSRAGGPLYEARLAFETLTMPTDPEARLEAELAQAQARLADVVEAAGHGDDGGIAAALAAYGRSLDDLEALSGDPADRAMEAIQFHRTVLLRLAGTVPEQALVGLENALERSSAVIDKLGEAGGAGPGEAGAGPGEPGGPGAGGPGGPGAGAPGVKPEKPSAAKSPDPRPTPKPAKSSKPGTREPGPAATPDNQNRQ
jgi:hypothetical protein